MSFPASPESLAANFSLPLAAHSISGPLGNIRLAFCQGIEGGSDVYREGGGGGGGGGEKEIERERGGGVGGMKGGGRGELGTGDTSPIQ